MNDEFNASLKFRDRLKLLRKASCLNQNKLASMVGLSSSYISKLETGKQFPSAKALNALAKTFNVSASYLLSGCDCPTDELIDKAASMMSPKERKVLKNIIGSMNTKDSDK